MTIHLYLAPLPLHTGPSMLLATTPEAAISLLRTGLVTRLSVSEEWSKSCDPKNRVAKFFHDAKRAGDIALPEWKVENFSELLSSPEAITRQLLDRCGRFEHKAERHSLPLTDNPALLPDRQFTNFIPKPGSQNAYAVATLASQKNRPERSPLIIFGPSGSGKTHLLHGIGHSWMRFNAPSGGRLLVLTAKTFQEDDRAAGQIAALGSGDCLLFDDLESLPATALALFADLCMGTVGKNIGLVFSFRGTRAEIAKVACSVFSGYQNLCLVELVGDEP